VRQGYEPDAEAPKQPHDTENQHNLDDPFSVGEDPEDSGAAEGDEGGGGETWRHREYKDGDDQPNGKTPQYGSFHDEQDVWGSPSRR